MIWDTTKYFLNYDKNIRKIYVNNFKFSRKNYFKIIEKISKKDLIVLIGGFHL